MNLQTTIFEKKPWVRGIVETLYSAELLSKTNLQNRDRIRLILLDTALEVSFKGYLANEKKISIDKRLSREDLNKTVKKQTNFSEEDWKRIDYFYKIRCDLYHETAGKTLMPSDMNDFHKLTNFMITSLFELPVEILDVDVTKLIEPLKNKVYVPINNLKPIEQIIYVVGRFSPKASKDINGAMKELGCRRPLKPTIITTYMKNQSYTHFFVHKGDAIKLSEQGEFIFSKIIENYQNQGGMLK